MCTDSMKGLLNCDKDMTEFDHCRKNLYVWEFLPICNKAKVGQIPQLWPIAGHFSVVVKDFLVYPFFFKLVIKKIKFPETLKNYS